MAYPDFPAAVVGFVIADYDVKRRLFSGVVYANDRQYSFYFACKLFAESAEALSNNEVVFTHFTQVFFLPQTLALTRLQRIMTAVKSAVQECILLRLVAALAPTSQLSFRTISRVIDPSFYALSCAIVRVLQVVHRYEYMSRTD